MKKIIVLLIILALPLSPRATNIQVMEIFTDGGPVTPDSVRLKMYGSTGDSIYTKLWTSGFSYILNDSIKEDFSAQVSLSGVFHVFSGNDTTFDIVDYSNQLTRDVNVASVDNNAIEEGDIGNDAINALVTKDGCIDDDAIATLAYLKMADYIWDEPRSGHVTGNTFGGDALDNDVWTDAKAGYLDATISSRSDFDETADSTMASANVASMNSGVITAAVIATDAIGESELGANAITSSELATAAVTEIEAAIYANRADYKADISALASQTSVTAIRDSIQYCVTATGFSTLDSAAIWGAVIQVLNDSSGTYQGTNFDSGAVWGAVVQVLNDSSATYQGSAAGLDSQAVWGAIVQVLNDSSGTYQGPAAGLDSAAVWGAICQVLNDSTTKYQGAAFDSGAVWGAVIQVLNDSASTYQGPGGSLDSGAVWGAICQVLNDSTTKYQGEGVDSSTIAAAVWNAPKANHPIGNTFGGDALDNDIWSYTISTYLDANISSRSTLTEESNIGIDLDDVVGTLDAPEIGGNAITSAKIDDDAIGSSELAASAAKKIADSVLNDSSHYKALGFSTHGAADVWSADSTPARTLTALGFDLDSTNFADSTFPTWLFTSDFFDSAQGAAASVTLAGIVDTVWGHAAREITGGAVDSNRTEQGGGSGPGPYVWYVYVLDSGNGNAALPGYTVAMNDTAMSLTSPYRGVTDANGMATLAPSAGYWRLTTAPYGYASIDSNNINITGAATCTLYTYSSSANKTSVYSTLLQANGYYYSNAEVRFELIAYPRDSILYFNDTIITQTIIYDTADAYGTWDVALYANPNLSDSSYYQVYFRDQYGKKIRRESGMFVHVPDTTSIAFEDLVKWR